MNPSPWRCPHCHSPLTRTEHSYTCANRHSYDQAREGYVNLLLVNRKHSADPGDSKAMLQSRREFLQRGFYAPLAEAITGAIQQHAPQTGSPLTVLDAGCGEGYYLGKLAEQLPAQTHFLGTDISRAAMRLIARQHKQMQFAVASSYDLPLPDASVDVLLRVFAPAADEEISRVLKPGGLYVWAHPGERHLYGLRELIYDAPQLHTLPEAFPPGLTLLEHRAVRYPLQLNDQAAVSGLLHMTPYYWAATIDKQAYCQSLSTLELEADFCLTLMRKSG